METPHLGLWITRRRRGPYGDSTGQMWITSADSDPLFVLESGDSPAFDFGQMDAFDARQQYPQQHLMFNGTP